MVKSVRLSKENTEKSKGGLKNAIYTLNHMFIAFNASYMTWQCFQAGFKDATTWHALFATIGVSF